ncbi:hypothetical protein HANVADRAFT_102113 [Hanseniaspora valbyensis NRRL Y-1626]|uniref:Uncharacterized protein n=1 Tax=Hanseniaspora valbyensis NRRL Y-1626 TaxID=766949 RepID=A0A1B7TAN2_9ASCO|nr:hypothetical protein HANVADRAFT_102113 [Hanseniaspora valbyensis NRRL Y-1626]
MRFVLMKLNFVIFLTIYTNQILLITEIDQIMLKEKNLIELTQPVVKGKNSQITKIIKSLLSNMNSELITFFD